MTFVRHTAVDVPPGVCYGQSDVGLKDSFPDEAADVKARISGGDYDAVFTSPLSRCVRLAGECGYPDAQRDERLKELNFGEWEMRRFDEIDDPRLQEWYDDYLNVRPTGGESFVDQRERLRQFIESLHCRHALVFAHGGILMNAMILAGIVTEDKVFTMQPPYGGSVTLEF